LVLLIQIIPIHARAGSASLWAAATLICIAVSGFCWWFGTSNPDDDGDDKALKPGASRFLVLYLISLSIIFIVCISFLINFNFTPVPSGIGYQDTFFGRSYLSLNMQLLLLGILSGALGSLIHGIKSLADFLGNRTAKTSWFWFYVTRPFMGGSLALIFYAVIRGGIMGGTPADASAVNPYGVVAICASQKLSQVFDTMFTTDDTRKDKMT
jgi:hypothetical protein